MRAALETQTAPRNAPSRALPVVPGDDRAAAHAFALKDKAAETKRAYRHDFVAFETYCAARGHPSMPSTPAAVAEFLAGEQARGCKASTLTRRVAAIRYAHRLAEHDSPTDSERVRAVLRGIKSVIGTQQTPKIAATADVLLAMLKSCDPATMRGKRDRALLALGFAGAFRRSELVALTVADLTEIPEGFRVLVRRSKTDQAGAGAEVAILRGKSLRPVEAVKAWLAAARITEGQLFRQVSKSGRVMPGALTAESAAAAVKHAAERVGLDPALFAGHSLRSGFLTSAAGVKGASILRMMDVSRHKSVETMRRYVQRANQFVDHAGEDFL
jgi:site-specific recombinase XerD